MRTYQVPSTKKAAKMAPPTDLTDWVLSFRARFPEFATATNEQVAYAIYDAMCFVDETWTDNCGDCGLAIIYLAAHWLALAKLANDVLTAGDDTVPGGVIIPGGQVTSLSFETMSVRFSAPRFAAARASRAGRKYPYDYSSTPYGQRYLDLLQNNIPAVVLV